MNMKNLIEKSRYISLIAVMLLLVTAALSLFWAAAKSVKAWSVIVSSLGQSSTISLYLIQVIDAFLIAIVLYILAVSLYEMFIGDLTLPDWMIARDLFELKNKLTSVIVLVITVRFVEQMLTENMPAFDILLLAVATAVVTGALVAFGYFSGKGKADKAID